MSTTSLGELTLRVELVTSPQSPPRGSPKPITVSKLGSPGDCLVNATAYVDAQYGDDSTGALNDPCLPYLTFDAALSAAQTSAVLAYTVHLRPGNYVSVGAVLTKEIHVYLESDATLTVNGSFTVGTSFFQISGFGEIISAGAPLISASGNFAINVHVNLPRIRGVIRSPAVDYRSKMKKRHLSKPMTSTSNKQPLNLPITWPKAEHSKVRERQVRPTTVDLVLSNPLLNIDADGEIMFNVDRVELTDRQLLLVGSRTVSINIEGQNYMAQTSSDDDDLIYFVRSDGDISTANIYYSVTKTSITDTSLAFDIAKGRLTFDAQLIEVGHASGNGSGVVLNVVNTGEMFGTVVEILTDLIGVSYFDGFSSITIGTLRSEQVGVQYLSSGAPSWHTLHIGILSINDTSNSPTGIGVYAQSLAETNNPNILFIYTGDLINAPSAGMQILGPLAIDINVVNITLISSNSALIAAGVILDQAGSSAPLTGSVVLSVLRSVSPGFTGVGIQVVDGVLASIEIGTAFGWLALISSLMSSPIPAFRTNLSVRAETAFQIGYCIYSNGGDIAFTINAVKECYYVSVTNLEFSSGLTSSHRYSVGEFLSTINGATVFLFLGTDENGGNASAQLPQRLEYDLGHATMTGNQSTIFVKEITPVGQGQRTDIVCRAGSTQSTRAIVLNSYIGGNSVNNTRTAETIFDFTLAKTSGSANEIVQIVGITSPTALITLKGKYVRTLTPGPVITTNNPIILQDAVIVATGNTNPALATITGLGAVRYYRNAQSNGVATNPILYGTLNSSLQVV